MREVGRKYAEFAIAVANSITEMIEGAAELLPQLRESLARYERAKDSFSILDEDAESNVE